MTRTVLIGKGRRVTLEELQSVCLYDGKLEMHAPSPPPPTSSSSSSDVHPSSEIVDSNNNLDELSLRAAISKLTIATVDSTVSDLLVVLLTPSDTLSALTLLALTISQNRLSHPSSSGKIAFETSSAIVQLVNHIKKYRDDDDNNDDKRSQLQLPSSPTEFLPSLQSLLPTTTNTTNLQSTIERILPLASIALSTIQLSSLTKSNALDALASLSVERTRVDPSVYFSDAKFDLDRPHRGMVGSAAVLRACTQGSKFATGSTGGGNTKKGESAPPPSKPTMQEEAVRSIPQIHGPCMDAISTAVKVLELECNCFPLVISGSSSTEEDNSNRLDQTVMDLAGKTVLDSAEILLQTCLARMGHEMETDTSSGGLAQTLERTVAQLYSFLQDEARLNGAFIETEITHAIAVATTKAEEKAVRAAAHAAAMAAKSTQTTTTNDTDEFKGMSEGKKAAILKKREAKAKKAATKAAKKKGPISNNDSTTTTTTAPSIFGAGTLSILTTIKSSNYNLTSSPTTLSALSSTIHSLLSGGIQRKPKIAKGTRDYLPDQMMIRDQAFQIIRRVFKSHGAVEIDTPVFELKDTLTGKYGEDSKLIYDLADQGGEVLALRYDLTVPFARFLALNAVGNIKRFHIGKVYRRDQPQLSKGRYREFYQCDFDIAGVFGRMVADSECLCVASEILAGLPIGEFGIKLNHRRLLDAILDLCGVPADKFRIICSAVDKLDKEPWEEVKREMVEDKGLNAEVADKIGVFVLQKGEPWTMYNSLMESKVFGTHVGANEAMEDLKILFKYLEAMDKLKYISFDLSLARGLDYYTGVIYEAVCMNGNTQVGSIGGGGRYDTLVSMFQEAGKVTPCVGVSVGIERVFTLMEERLRQEQGGSIKQPNVKVLVAQAGDNMMIERMKVSQLLWDAKISAEFNQQENPKLKFEITNALDRDIPFMVIIGEDEAKENKCKVKDLKARTEETVDQDQLVSTLRSKGVIPVGCEFAAEMLVTEKDKIST